MGLTPSRAVALSLLLLVALWTLIPGLLHTSLPMDMIESGAWGREHVLLSFKHPNLPGLLIEALYQLSGGQYGWPQYLLSAFWTGLAIWLVYLLGQSMFGGWAGAAGALLLTGCYYFTWPIPEFNHNIAQLPFWSAVALLLWRAVETNRLWLWVLLGLVAGLGLYAKLSMLTVIAAGGIWILVDAKARARLATLPPWGGLLAFALVGGAFAWQMFGEGGGLITFLRQSGSIGTGPIHFVVAQLLDIVPLLVLVGIALLLPRKRGDTVVRSEADLPRIRLFLAVLIGIPLLQGTVTAAVLGAQTMWGAPMLNLVGLAIVAAWPRRFDAIAVRRVLIGALVLIVLFPSLFAVRFLVADTSGVTPMRSQWPQQEISARFAQKFEATTGVPLRIVGGVDWQAGLVALSLNPRGSVFYQLDRRLSPWVTDEQVKREGMLVVWYGDNPTPAYAEPYLAANPHGVEEFKWSDSPNAKPVRIGYVIVPPQPAP